MTYNPISVSQLNKYIKDKFEEDEYFANVLVEGEISNFKNHYTGHMYFTLKDDKSLIKAIMFKNQALKLNFEPKEGMKIPLLLVVQDLGYISGWLPFSLLRFAPNKNRQAGIHLFQKLPIASFVRTNTLNMVLFLQFA